MANVVRLKSNFHRGHEVTINVVGSVYVNNIMGVETNPQHGLVSFIFFVLLGFLQIRYPENPTPFQVHPKITLVSIASFLLYCLVFGVDVLSRKLGIIWIHNNINIMVHFSYLGHDYWDTLTNEKEVETTLANFMTFSN